MNRQNILPLTKKEKTKDWQLEMLMEKLRSKSAQYKSIPEISKNVRMSLLEKRYASDSIEKSQHQKCLDTLQHSIKVTSLQSMVERLESLTRQLGLKFVVEPSGVFISSDMFYLEVVLDPSGAAKDVKIHHEGKKEQQSCIELVNCLSRGDFADFTAQLEGFTSVYQLNAEKKVKCKAFTALESLEADLSTLAQLQMFMIEPFNLIHKSPVGILEKRKGGHPMKLTYFVSPYDLLNIEKNEIDPIVVDNVISKNLGYNVTVCMEGSAAHKLQTTTLITVNRNINGKSTPSYTPLTGQNSAVVPACFMLKLNKPLPMSLSLVRQIQQIHPWTEIDSAPVQPLLNLIVTHCSEGKMTSSNNKGLFVTLPDQNHCYFMTENKNMNGVLVNSIPFTHPAHVSSILMILREQALFNSIISSCVRPNSKQDFENMTMFEVSALSSTHISISLEHPVEESMATAEIDLSDISNLACRVTNPGTPPPISAPDAASDLSTKILNKSFSLPITLRSVIKLWEKQSARRTHYGGPENFSLPLGQGDPGGPKEPPNPRFGGPDKGTMKQEPNNGEGAHSLDDAMMQQNFQRFPPSDGVLANMELNNMLTDASDKLNKRQKRKLNEDAWKIGKRKAGTEDSDLVESSSCDSTSRSTPLSSQDTEIRTPNSLLGFHTDLELSVLDPIELLGSSDKSDAGFDNLDDLDSDKSPLGEINEKVTPAHVSITPVPANPTVGFAKENEKVEKISVPNSITITPIVSKPVEEKPKEKKSKSNREDKNRLEKKKRKKHDDSPMGPPDKVPFKQDPLTKPVTVSIKATESPPLSTSTPTSPSTMRKYSSSPTQNRSDKPSPGSLLKPAQSSTSPRHSPVNVSPKHSLPSGVSSPKHHGSSPKHSSGGGSGKPSISALKSAASSPSNKGGGDVKAKSSLRDGSRDKDKKNSGLFGVNNSKTKSSSIKTKSSEVNAVDATSDGLSSPTATGDSSKTNANQARNRKGSLSAIVDKLKVNAQHCDIATDLSSKSTGNKERTGSSAHKSGESGGGKSGGKVGEMKNSEYMVKPSSDGMKITINKTRSKESPGNKGTTAGNVNKGVTTGSPKTHTGLKPGVNSGPASKKPQQLQKSTTTSNTTPNSTNMTYNNNLKNSSTSNKLTKSPSSLSGTNSNIGGVSKTISKLSPNLKSSSSATDLSKTKDRIKSSKTEKPVSTREEVDSVYKMTQSSLMVKTLDKNFQIPKLSARMNDDKKLNNVTKGPYNLVTKNDVSVSKYPLVVQGGKHFDGAMELKMRNSVNNVPMILGGDEDGFKAKDLSQNLSNVQRGHNQTRPTHPKPVSLIHSRTSEPLDQTRRRGVQIRRHGVEIRRPGAQGSPQTRRGSGFQRQAGPSVSSVALGQRAYREVA
ncbi:unnamed protein product [Phaedon cochleariae]|uniref:Mediator of RNA polymerase II transcription subunit 1 n=1 Tax=Phaedon cochleariae TaxID=80249 RepID=A0A9P0DLD8_PHACE|nr:unnamed protein product [Phaedon cochleariae]